MTSSRPSENELTNPNRVMWVELPQEAVDNMDSCDDNCELEGRYHNHWHCTESGCKKHPAKPVVTASTARSEKDGILRGRIWGGKALCLEHDSSVRWDSVQGRQVRGEDEDEWEDRRLEELRDEEAEEYVPKVVEWVRATWTARTAEEFNLSDEVIYQPNIICLACGREPARPVVSFIEFIHSDLDPDWEEVGELKALCERHDKSVSPSVARAYLRRLRAAREKRREKAKAKEARE